MAKIQFQVNGRSRAVELPGDTPLLWVLRDTLGLTGTKFGCGLGQCGACTVLLDGHAVQSCQTPISACEGKRITTVEGLSADHGHPVQRAWLQEDVAQCGYCQPGMMMAAAGLLAEKPKPGDADIEAAFADHLCRCGTYGRIRKAVKLAAEGGAK